jgi:hypothetical protein
MWLKNDWTLSPCDIKNYETDKLLRWQLEEIGLCLKN